MQVDEGEADRNTVGHFSPYITHRLNPLAEEKQRKNNFEIKQLQVSWAEHTNDIALDFVGSQLVSLKRTNSLNPYLNIQVDKKLIKDHNDIWGIRIIKFISDLIAISTTPIAN